MRLLGLCTRLLAASAVASVDSLIALLPVTVETVRIAFRTGAHVADVAKRLDLSTTPESWSTIVAVADADAADKALNNLHQEQVRVTSLLDLSQCQVECREYLPRIAFTLVL